MDGLPEIELAPTLAALGTAPRVAFGRLHSMGIRYVQLSATQPDARPRDLGRSARRDLVATLRRHELSVGGMDAWIPPEHFLDPNQVDRAVAAMLEIVVLAGDLGRCPVSFSLPRAGDGAFPEALIEARAMIVDAAETNGVVLADHGRPVINDDRVGVGIDPAAWLSTGDDPISAVTSTSGRLTSARLADLDTSGLRAPAGVPGGRLDTLAYQVALAASGYVRPIVVDTRQWSDPWGGLTQTQRVWSRAAW